MGYDVAHKQYQQSKEILALELEFCLLGKHCMTSYYHYHQSFQSGQCLPATLTCWSSEFCSNHYGTHKWNHGDLSLWWIQVPKIYKRNSFVCWHAKCKWENRSCLLRLYSLPIRCGQREVKSHNTDHYHNAARESTLSSTPRFDVPIRMMVSAPSNLHHHVQQEPPEVSMQSHFFSATTKKPRWLKVIHRTVNGISANFRSECCNVLYMPFQYLYKVLKEAYFILFLFVHDLESWPLANCATCCLWIQPWQVPPVLHCATLDIQLQVMHSHGGPHSLAKPTTDHNWQYTTTGTCMR